MALQLGELSIALELENDKFRAGLANAKRDLESVPPAARREMVKVSRVMDEEGRKSGGLLARGINSGLMRNSPLIVAGVGAALAAGAPVMLAAAGTLFAGVGAAAAAQTVEVRSAWTELGRDIRDGAVADAAVLVPVYTEMADQIGFAFQRIRPQLREAFADSAPLVGSFTGGVIALAENAMPGLVRAVERGQPVFQGLEHFLGTVGYGATEFLDAISSHGPAAGAVFASLGDIVGDLLPIIGELVGQGAELAADVLPAVAAATGITLDVLQLLGPLLPSIVTGFIAFKAAKAAAGYLQTFAVQAQYATIAATGSVKAGERVGGAMSKAADGVGKASAALPVLGILLAGISSGLSDVTGEEERWAQALLAGGQAAAATRSEMASQEDYLLRGIDEWTGLASSTEDAEQAARDMYNAMTPLGRAQQDVTKATNDLSYAVDEYGPASSQAAVAADALTAAERELERQNAATELAIHGVTAAMLEQGEQALASIDSGFAYRKSLDDLEDAQAALNDAYANGSAEDQQRMQLALEEQTYNTALAFGQQQADLSGLSKDSLEYKRIIQEQMLGELHRLHDAAGPEMQAAIAAQIAALEESGVKVGENATLLAGLTGQVQGLTGSIEQIPGQKFVRIDAPTAAQIQQMKDLGYEVIHLPNGDVYVTADTQAAELAIAYAARERWATIRVRSVMDDLNGSVSGSGRMGTAATGGAVEHIRMHSFDSGGGVFGPGGGTDDLVPALGPDRNARYRLSNGEHIITAAEVRAAGGHGAVLGIRQAMLAGAFRYAGGGDVPRRESIPATAVMDRREGPLFHADTVNVIEGTPQDIAQELAYQGRTRGW